MFVLANDFIPRLEKIEISGNKLTKVSEIQLSNFVFTDLKMRISSSQKEIVLTGRMKTNFDDFYT